MKKVRGCDYLYSRKGVFYFRRGVPADARPVFGQTEIIKSLATRELAVARHLVADELRAFEATLSTYRGAASPMEQASRSQFVPSLPDIEMAVRTWLLERYERLHQQSAKQFDLDIDQEENAIGDKRGVLEVLARGPKNAREAQWIADQLVEQYGWEIEPASLTFRRLKQMILRGQIESDERRRQETTGEPIRTLDQRFGPEQYLLDRDREPQKKGPSLKAMLDRFLAERKPAPATVKAYRLQFSQFLEFLKHDDVSLVTAKDVVRWKDVLQGRLTRNGTPLSPKTINSKYLAVISVVFSWAVQNHEVELNPAQGVRMRSGKQIKLRDRSLSDIEAMKILRATVAGSSARISPEHALARRWVPWICAYTGARVNEITQLRAEDIQLIDSIWAIHITPEAGSVKTGEARTVALHPHIMEQGFLDAIHGREGPLFYDPRRRRGGKDGNPQYKKVGERLAKWVRSVGVNDPLVQPNHGWRHRFKTQSRRCRMDPEVRDYIQGHKPRTEGEDYGEIDVEMTFREISLLARYELGSRP